MPAEIWKDRDVAKAFLNERSLIIPDRPRQLEVIHRVVGFHCPKPRRVLDVGSGDAILLAALLESFPGASGVAVDYGASVIIAKSGDAAEQVALTRRNFISARAKG